MSTTDAPDVTPITKLKGPADAAAMIPYVMGFQPHDSLVVVSLEGERKRFGPTLRVDLVDDPRLVEAQTAQIVHVVTRNASALVLVAAFSDDAAQADPLVRRVLAALEGRGVAIEDAFRVGGGRWWSYRCENPECCSPDGMPYDPGASRVAAEAVVSGMTVAEDRDALRAMFAPADPGRRAEVAREIVRLRREEMSILPGPAVGELPSRVGSALGRAPTLDVSETAWLALAVQPFSGREAAFVLIERANAARHLDLWRAVMAQIADDLLPPVGCLAAFAAWLDGCGVLASHAVERVFEISPHYPLACRIDDLLLGVVDPRSWPAPS